MIIEVLGAACLGWYLFILAVSTIGVLQLYGDISFQTKWLANKHPGNVTSHPDLHSRSPPTFPSLKSLTSPSSDPSKVSSPISTPASPQPFNRPIPSLDSLSTSAFRPVMIPPTQSSRPSSMTSPPSTPRSSSKTKTQTSMARASMIWARTPKSVT